MSNKGEREEGINRHDEEGEREGTWRVERSANPT